MSGLVEHAFTCPYCWETITVLVDAPPQPAVGVPAEQRWVEDCEVCCNPIDLWAAVEEGEVVGFRADLLGQ